jgi:hypothetical protein
MKAFEELLYLHPASVVSRLAAQEPTPDVKAAEKPKRERPEPRLTIRRLRPRTT